MSHDIQHDPYEILLDIEHRSKLNAAGLPQQVEIKKPWSGIGFKVGKINLLSRIGAVNEILDYPKVTIVPGTKPWVMGMANIRGNLLPVIDLKGYLGGDVTKLNQRSRVLVINKGTLSVGLLVDEVLGLKHFYQDEQIKQKPNVDEKLKQYLIGGYKQNETSWYIFNFQALAQDPDFLLVTA